MTSNICSDKCKSANSILLVTVCLLNLGLAAVIFFQTYVNISTFKVHGGEYLPSLNINFDSFSYYIFFSICAVVGLLITGLLAAQCKKPYVALAYALLAFGSGCLLSYTSYLAMQYELKPDSICGVTNQNIT